MSLLGRLVESATTVVTAPIGLAAGSARNLAGALPSPEALTALGAAVKELAGGRPSRRCWRNGDRCWIELRGLDGDNGKALGKAVLNAIRAEDGVRTVGLNHALSRVVVTVSDDGPAMERLCGLVAEVERGVGADADLPTELPADGIVLAGKVIAATANGVGLCTAVAGRALMWPALPAGLVAAVTLVDYQPRLREVVEQRLGRSAADTAIALAAATVYTVTEAPTSLAVETVRHLYQVGEALAGSRAWERQEPAIAPYADDPDAGARPQRPRPAPPGPVERHADRTGMAQGLAAAAVGLFSRNLNTAATAAVVSTPKAARNAREGFASALGRGLADNHNIIALDPQAIRRLDRVDAVVLDPQILLTGELRIGRLRGISDRDRAAAWQWARESLERGDLGVGWQRAPLRNNGSANGAATAEVLVRHVHHPLAASVLGEVRRAGAELISVQSDELDDLRPSFDELYPLDGPVDAALLGAVIALQGEGRTVAVIATHAPQALSAADVAVGLIPDDGPPPWHADLLAPDLDAVWRVMHALPAARRASKRGVELATSASMLGALLMIPGVRGRGPGPVTAGAAAGLTTGLLLARGALNDQTPTPATVYEWHAMSPDEVRDTLPQPKREAAQRKSRVASAASTSANVIPLVAGPPLRLARDLTVSLRQELSDPLTPILAVGSAASALLGSPVDAILVGSVLAGNSLLAASQQVRAERLLSRLLAVQVPPARLVTDDGYETIDAAQLRPGDLIEVRPGEVVPADARIVEATDAELDESSLTGESLPVPKRAAATPGATLAERSCMLHGSTTVVAGTAVALVTAVGDQTQASRAVHVQSAEKSAVGLQAQLRDLTDRALPLSLAGGALVSGLGLLRMVPLRRAVASGVAVAVAAVPEGMPLVATLAQQTAARRLTRAGVLVRTPRSVEALGRIDVVCFDKTGTLSENRLRVTQVHHADGVTREQVLDCAAHATPAKNGHRHEHATDAAVVEAAGDQYRPDPDATYLPFRSGRPFSASLIDSELSIKGAPEVVLAACTGLDPKAKRTVHQMAGSGLRVIAVARRSLTKQQAQRARRSDEALIDLCDKGLQFVGLLGLSDTPRAESASLLAALQKQDVGVRLITGDHPVTATAIAAELGMPVTADQVISGGDWEALSRRGQERAVRDGLVFARMTPEHKVQVVQTLERIGQVCAMVGDGANDAAAIRAATVGIGVASRGSDPARTAADVMLLDGRIGSLLDALDEGRQLWRRVQAAVSVLLGGNAGEVAFSIVGSALTGRSPLNTRQLLLVNMMTDALPAAALAVSPARPNGENGHGPNHAAIWRTVAIRGTTTAAAATSAWLMGGFIVAPRRASTVALVALVTTQLGQTLIDSHSPLVVATAVGSLATLGALISTPGVSQVLGCTPLGPLGWTQALGTAGVATAAAGCAPWVLRRVQSSISTTPTRHSTAYSSRSGIANKPETTVNGSEEVFTPVVDTPPTVRTSSVQTSNTP
ncbi:haloacid dehalogenase [Mycobacterium sp. GA-1999]|nr:haloacid dehalogenase [Mycobacterium sp. IS-1556]KUH83223.1 haloacid dehalogenase [Mycobacterium sp. GA-0227b]KUH84367.1 haloacid dehalogenase [Mycobacterium sp. GA-1999]